MHGKSFPLNLLVLVCRDVEEEGGQSVVGVRTVLEDATRLSLTPEKIMEREPHGGE